MADVITRFKLETTQFDSKLRDTAKELQGIAKQAKDAGKDFAGFDKGALEAARALGTVASGANNTKDKLRDLVGSFNDASKVYNSLTEEVKKGEFGQVLSASLQKLQKDIKKTKEELYGLGEGVSGGGIFSNLGDKMSGALSVFGGNMMTKAADFALDAVSSLASEIGGAVKQGIELAKQGEGIRLAFERLGRGDILDGLRKSTHGTVSDIELMKAAVKFNDFQLPLEELGTMLAFAQQKAKDTGQSVDYMVDSIVTGLGRKSLMILDNLGLSATQVRDKMAETGDMTKAVGEIIREQMSNAGDYVETVADRATQANVSLQNKMEELGRKFAPLEEASNQLWTSMKIGILDIIGGPLARLLNDLTEAGRLKNMLDDVNGSSGSGNTQVDKNLKRLKDARANGASDEMLVQWRDRVADRYRGKVSSADAYINQYNAQHSSINEVLQDASKEFGRKFSSINELKAFRNSYQVMLDEYLQGAEKIMKPIVPEIDTNKAGKSIEELKVKLIELEAQYKKAIQAGDTDQSNSLKKQISQLKSDIKGLDPNALKTTKTDKKVAPEGSIAAQEQLVQNLTKKWEEATDQVGRDGYLKQLDEAKKKLEQMKSGDDIEKLFPKLDVSGQQSGPQRSFMDQARQDYAVQLSDKNMLVDETTLHSLMSTAIQNGIDRLDPDFTTIKEKMSEGMDIPDETWQGLQDTINAKLKELGIEPIKLDFKTGEVKAQAAEMAKNWQAAGSAIQSVGQAMSAIEDPAAKVVGTVAQAVATMALSYAEASVNAAKNPAMAGWGWIAFAATGLATMLTSISAIKNASHFAQGGIVPGNDYSDNTPVLVSSGELILNKSQQNTLATELTRQDGQGFVCQPYVLGQNVYLGMNNYLQGAGQGQIVTTSMLRRMGII